MAEEITRAVSLEAEEYIEERAPVLRKEARARYVQNSPLLEFAEADIAKLWEQPGLFPDDCFDRILVVNALMFIPDLISGLKELRRVLKPTGRMVCVVKCSHVKSGIERGQLGSLDHTNQIPASTDPKGPRDREISVVVVFQVHSSVWSAVIEAPHSTGREPI